MSDLRAEVSWVRRNPVAALTSALTVILAGDGLLIGLSVLNAHQASVAVAIEAFLTVLLGAITHQNTTSTAKPKDEDGNPLVRAASGPYDPPGGY